MKISDLKAADYNPRKIDQESLGALKASLRHFGDISGIVFNRRTGNLVAGHQRVRALIEEHGDALEIFQDGYEGRIKLPDGSHVRVRFVDWDEATEKAANVAANNPHIQGTFTDSLADVLREIDVALPDLAIDIRLDLLLDGPEEGDKPGKTLTPPGEFKEYSGQVKTSHCCPSCGYEW